MSAANLPVLMAALARLFPDFVLDCSRPPLVVEIVSPSNWRQSWANVIRYTTIEGFDEVLVLHSARMLAQVFRRGTSGAWDNMAVMTAGDEMVELTSIGFTAPLAAFYRTVA
jgi:Uma2 family endonuclease